VKKVRGLFSLAHKMAPSFLFIDEIDTVLSSRSNNSQHEASLQLLGEFLSLWDGLSGAQSQANALCTNNAIVVVAATNRIQDVDSAVQRRLPLQFEFPLPSERQRAQILSLYMKPLKCDFALPTGSSFSQLPDFAFLVKATDGFSGSDIHELVKAAASSPIREHIRRHKNIQDATKNIDGSEPITDATEAQSVRPLRIGDFEAAFRIVRQDLKKKNPSLDYEQFAKNFAKTLAKNFA